MNITPGFVAQPSVASGAMTFDTRVVAPHERIDYWEEHCAEKVVGLRCSCLSEKGLEARYHHYDFGRMKMIDIAGDEHFIERTPHLLRRREKDSAFLTVILNGKTFLNRAGQCLVAEAGDVVLYDTNHAYMHGFPAFARQVIFEIPGEDFRQRFGEWSLRDVVHFSGANNLARTIPLALQDVLRQAQSSNLTNVMTGAPLEKKVWDVMETAYSLVHGGVRSAYHAQLLQRARKYITENLGDPELGPAAVADFMGISLRQVNRLFEGEPLSLLAHIQEKRLEGARRDLLQHGGFATSVSDVCYKWGFKSLAHFSRKFSERYGVSPSRCR
ncbi:AraC-like DNA-binding protein [Rhizobium sp. SG_E_25_P2]|uniref:helix-turn-helix domain-containing protein n=1 Tax=Rhizobium sp. SG_E_25_P2 TaxID=2879942 RepID=UPI0024737369|nr:helix-turn-helix domain-containing protein [Rhizobium sp. SG_E_25_P2]MDH6266027.1 AraC-like DNA-binding protein [Rhizobium sp. SG_E_25_P2]